MRMKYTEEALKRATRGKLVQSMSPGLLARLKGYESKLGLSSLEREPTNACSVQRGRRGLLE